MREREKSRKSNRKRKLKGIKSIVFDRNKRLYHGLIKNLADGARQEGLKF